MSHSSKSPYEIRLNALELARKTLAEQFAAESAKEHLASHEDGACVVTRAPTVDEVIVAAEKLNNFISKSGGDHR